MGTANLTESHRLAIAEGRDDGDDPFLEWIREHGGYTLRSLAEALDVYPSSISMNRHKYPVPWKRALKIYELTEWPADEAHWPAGIRRPKKKN